jgi:hypothetical protein
MKEKSNGRAISNIFSIFKRYFYILLIVIILMVSYVVLTHSTNNSILPNINKTSCFDVINSTNINSTQVECFGTCEYMTQKLTNANHTVNVTQITEICR